MRKLLLLLLITLAVSCKKAEDTTNLRSSIAGTWELEKSIGFVTMSLPPGNGKLIVLGKDGSYSRMQHDTLLFSGSYMLSRKNDCYPRTSNIVFATNEGFSPSFSYIELVDGELILSSPNCYMDGGTAYYRRVK